MSITLTGCVLGRPPITQLIDVRASIADDIPSRGIPLLYCNPGTDVADGDALVAACASGRQSACVRQGVGMALGRTGRADPESALQLFETACTAGDACGCLDVAAVLGSRRDRASLTRATELARQECDNGLARACAVLGVDYRGGISVGDGGPPVLPRDPVASFTFASRACEVHDGAGCYQVAADYIAGTGVSPSDQHGVEHLQEACNDGVDIACTMEGFARLDGRGCAQDTTASMERFDRACTLGDPLGCFAQARMYLDGIIPTDDPTLAPALMAQACAGGIRAACVGTR